MDILNIKNITYNDNQQIRLFASENFNWYLQKGTGVSCTWGKDIKQTPMYDPLGPQQLLWKITSFSLNKYIKIFNYLANIRKKQNDNILLISDQNYIEQKSNYICMSTLSNIIFIFDTLDQINLEQFKLFCDYISFFNINIKIQYNISTYDITQIYNQLYNFSCRLILNVSANIFNGKRLVGLMQELRKQFDISIKLHINETSNIQISKFIDTIDKDISCTLYIQKPYLSVRKYLNLQSKILAKQLTNICLNQCGKKYYSKSVIGSIIMELPCSACRYTLYLENQNIFDCEINKHNIGNINQFTTLDKLWNAKQIVALRTKLIDENKC